MPASTDVHVYPDVTGDGVVSPLDVLLVVNYLNDRRADKLGGEAVGDGEGGAWAGMPCRPGIVPPALPAAASQASPRRVGRRVSRHWTIDPDLHRADWEALLEVLASDRVLVSERDRRA